MAKDSDPAITKEKASKEVKKDTYKRRKELLNVVKTIGFTNARRQAKTWAKHYKITERSIYRDFIWIKQNYKPEDLPEIKINLSIARDQALARAMDILGTVGAGREESLKAIDSVIKASKHYREELEAWGEKEKVAEKQDVTHVVEFIDDGKKINTNETQSSSKPKKV